MLFTQPCEALTLTHASRVDAERVGSILGIGGRSYALPGITLLEKLVTMNATLWASAAWSRHVFNRRVLLRTDEISFL